LNDLTNSKKNLIKSIEIIKNTDPPTGKGGTGKPPERSGGGEESRATALPVEALAKAGARDDTSLTCGSRVLVGD